VVELTVLDGKTYQSLLDAGRGGDEAAALGCALLANNQGAPLLANGTRGSGGGGGAAASVPASPSSPSVAAAVAASLASPDGRVLLGLVSHAAAAAAAVTGHGNGSGGGSAGQGAAFTAAPLTGVSITGSSESLLSGQRPPFRLLARALDAGTRQPARGVAFAVSDAFVVATPRVRTAVKAEIPLASDHVSKLTAVGPQTQAKLADIAAAWRAASIAAVSSGGGGGSGGVGGGGGVAAGSSSTALLADPDLPRAVLPHARVTTVGQFRDLADAAAAEGPELTDALKRVLKLTKGWEAACEHAGTAVEVDGRCRVWYDCLDDGSGRQNFTSREGLVFPGALGAVDLSAPIGLLRPVVGDGGGGGGGSSSSSRLTAVARLGAADASRAISMRAAAARAWALPGHPGWTLWEGSTSQDVSARAARGDVVIGGSSSSSAAAAAAAAPPPPPPPMMPSMPLPSRLPTMSWGLLAGTTGAPHFAPPAAAAAPAPPPPPPPPDAGKAAPIPASPFGVAAFAPAVPAAAKRLLPPTSGFAAAAAAAAASSKGLVDSHQRRANAPASAQAVDAAALQARLSQLVGRRLSGLDMARVIPTFPSVPLNADIFTATPLEALEFSRSELAKMEDWEQQQQQQQQQPKRARTAAANGPAANAPLAADRPRDESLLRFLSERLQAAPGSGPAAGAGLEGRASGLEGMLLSGVVAAAAAAPRAQAAAATAGGGGSDKRGGQLHVPGLSTLPTLAPLVTASPSLFPGGAAGEEEGGGALAGGGRRSSRRQQQKKKR